MTGGRVRLGYRYKPNLVLGALLLCGGHFDIRGVQLGEDGASSYQPTARRRPRSIQHCRLINARHQMRGRAAGVKEQVESSPHKRPLRERRQCGGCRTCAQNSPARVGDHPTEVGSLRTIRVRGHTVFRP